MKRIFQAPDAAFPLALSLVLLAAVGFVASALPASEARAESSAWLLAALLAAGFAMSLLRPQRGLALGSAVLAPITLLFGPIAAGFVAGALRAAQLVARPPESPEGKRRHSRPAPGQLLGSALTAVLAGLVASAVWFRGAGVAPTTSAAMSVLGWAVLAGLLQAAVLGVADRAAVWVGAEKAGAKHPLDSRLLLEPVGWALGGVLVLVVVGAGGAVAMAVLVALALMAVELTRNEVRLARRERQIETLSEMSHIGHRMGGPQSELTRVAEQILGECRKLVPAQWVQLEVIDREVERISWQAGPDGYVEEGVPRPPETPPAIPGVHRRASWQVLDKDLYAGDRLIGTLRLWTDPRQIEWEQIELLDALLPQLATSLGAVLADQKANRDALTGVSTRSVLEERLEHAFEIACLEGGAMAVVMCDADHFKRINDQHGHAVGDRALQEIATTLERHSRGRDTVCRYGGEEFTVLMEGAGAAAAVAAAERLRKAVEEIRIHVDGEAVELTLSLGVVSFPETYVGSGAELVPLADAALYEAKRRGRNRTLLALGQGRFKNHRGRLLKSRAKAEETEAPRLFV